MKNFISSYILLYRKIAQNYLMKILESKSLEYIDKQVIIEKATNVSIMQKYKRKKEKFKEIIYQFCNDNFYYFAQKYLIYRLFKDLFEDLSENLSKNIIEKMEKFLSSKEIKERYRKIYFKVFEDFEKSIDKPRDENGKIYN